MTLFWDSSAILALVYEEVHTSEAQQAWSQSTMNYAWRWASVEAYAGLTRRGAHAEQTANLKRILASLIFVDLRPDQIDALGQRNMEWRLRAADAGHIFCMKQLSLVFPDLQFVCFDDEINDLALKLALRRWNPAEQGPQSFPSVVREERVEYGSKRSTTERMKRISRKA